MKGLNGKELNGGTLCIDIGGSNLKLMVLDPEGQPLSERERTSTPKPAKPKAVLGALETLTDRAPGFERVSVGFPGVVIEGVVQTAPNLDTSWEGYDLCRALRERLSRPVRVANDADVQGLAVIEGSGLELVVTLGTGFGSALFIDGRLVPNLELGHHPFRKGATYEEYLSREALDEIGAERWVRRVGKAVDQLQHTFNFRLLHIGGGNAKQLHDAGLPDNVRIVDNVAGILGGLRLWA
jgi:polyphosphate glucokinase